MTDGLVGRIDTAPRERDLAGMLAEMDRPMSQDDVQQPVALAQATEYGGTPLLVQAELFGLHIRVEVEIRPLAERRQCDRRLDIADRQRHAI